MPANQVCIPKNSDATTPFYTTEEVRLLETQAVTQDDTTGALMQRAAKAALTYLRKRWPKARRLHIFCGNGNNGGDGYTLASLVKSQGYHVHIWRAEETLPAAETLAGKAWATCERMGILCHTLSAERLHAIPAADVCVDALLGIGCRGEVRAPIADVIRYLNTVSVPILSLDVPSGVDADTGSIGGVAVRATATITFMVGKVGLFTGKALNYVGDCIVDSLGMFVPDEIVPCATALAAPTSAVWSVRQRDTHKGEFGHVLIVGGAPGFHGAVRLAALGAIRVGAGAVSIATDPAHAAWMNLAQPEIMTHGVQSPKDLQVLLHQANSIVLGPGLGTTSWAVALWEMLMGQKAPLVLDADGLNLLAKYNRTRADCVLTPHPGEAARLLYTTSAHVQADRLDAAKELQKKYHGVVVLKGAGTVIADGVRTPAICLRGNPGMASAGMGDVLSGMIGGFIAQGLSMTDAARTAVWLHATAGDKLATEYGERGLLASDILPMVRQLIKEKRGI